MTEQQRRCLAILAEGPLGLGDLASHMRTSRHGAAATASSLVRRGLLCRFRDRAGHVAYGLAKEDTAAPLIAALREAEQRGAELERELAHLYVRVYSLTYSKEWDKRHASHCLIPEPNVDLDCPICVGNGWLRYALAQQEQPNE